MQKMHRLALALLFCAVASGINNGLGRTPALGWSTWCTEGKCGRDVCSEGEILDAARAMKANGLLSAGYNLIALDGTNNPFRYFIVTVRYAHVNIAINTRTHTCTLNIIA